MKANLRFLCLCLALIAMGTASRAQVPATITVPSTAYPALQNVIDSLNILGVGSSGTTVTITTGNPQTASTTGYRLGSAVLNASTSASKQIVINGNGNTITAGAGTGSADGVFFIMGTDYVTINNLGILDPATNLTATTRMEWGYVLCKRNTTAPYDGCQNDKINGCTITMASGYASAYGIYAGHVAAGSTTVLSTTGVTLTDANSFNSFTGNIITGITRGINLIGINNNGFYDRMNQVGGSTAASGNNISVGGSTNTVYGVYTQYDSTITVQNNTFSINNAQNGVVYFINPSTGIGDLQINNNTFNVNCSMASGSVYCAYNTAHMESTSASASNITTHSFSSNTVFGNNLTATSSNMYAWYDYYTYFGNLVVNNNNISNINWGASTGTIYGLYSYYNGANNVTVNNNTLYNIVKTGTSGYIYAIYNYEYNSVGNGLFTSNNNVVRKLINNYYIYTYYNYASYNTGTTGHLLRVKYNKADSIDISGSASAYIYNYIGFYGKDSSEVSYDTVTNNFLPAQTTTSTGGMYNYFGYFYYAPTGKCVGNYMGKITGTSPYFSTYMGYYCKLTDNNTIENINCTGTSGTWYLYLGYYGTNMIVSNNTVRNLTMGVTSMYNYTGYYGTGPGIVNNNTIKNITLTSSGTLYNYFCYGVAGVKAYNNTIDSLTITTGSTLYGMYTYATGNDTMYNNRVSNLRVLSNNTATVYGYYLQPSATGIRYDFYNNVMSNIEVPATYASTNLYGIYTSGTGDYRIYNNTVRISPTATFTGATLGATGFYMQTTGTYDLRNNIFYVNVTPIGSGTTAALRRSSGSTGVSPANFLSSSNSNIYFAPNTTNSWLYAEGTSSSAVNAYNLTNDPSFNTPCGLFKTFIGHDMSSFTENNLILGSLPGTYLPNGASYAKNGATSTVVPAVTTDYAGITRPVPSDIGALQFTGTALDNAPPQIAYTPLDKTSYCVSCPTLITTITDQTGVNNTTGTAPRLYYKKSTETNAFGGGNTSATNGWKYVEASSISGSVYTFNFDCSKFTSTLIAGDSVTYFVIAQDITTSVNTAATIAGFPSCVTPNGVNLTATFGPLSASPVPNGFKILTTPTFTLPATYNSLCVSGTTTISVLPIPVGTTIQWQSATLTGTFSNIAGATASTYTTPLLTATTRYRAVLSCGASTLTTTVIDTITVNNPSIVSTIPGARCGYGPVTLGTTVTAGTNVNWYTSATSSNPIAVGVSYTTANLSASATYYAAAVVPRGSTEILTKPASIASTPQTWAGGFAGAGLDLHFSDTTNFYSTTVYAVTAGTVSLELDDSLGNVYATAGPYTMTTIGGNFTGANVLSLPTTWRNIPPGGYRIAITSATATLNYDYYSPQFPFPFYSNVTGRAWIKNNVYPGIGVYNYYYFFFYNNVISGPCENPTRYPVVATVSPSIPVTASSPNLPGICSGSSATLNATSTNGTYTYVWFANTLPVPLSASGAGAISGTSITVSPTTATKYYLYATDLLSGCTAIDSITINVNTQQPAPVITPGSQTICEKSVLQLTATPGSPFGGLSVIGTGTASNGPYSWPAPLAGYYMGDHEQYLVRASELTAAGVQPGSLTSLAFYLNAAPGRTLINFKMNLANTTLTALPAGSFVNPGFTNVYSATSYAPVVPTGGGWVTINFTTPFAWNGASNIVVDIFENSCTSCPASTCSSTYYSNGDARYSVTSFNSSNSVYSYGGCDITGYTPTQNASFLSYYTYRPNMRWGWNRPYFINWTNVTGLYKTYPPIANPLVLTDTNTVVYASPVTTQIYRAFTNAQGCISPLSNADTITVNPAPSVAITPAGPQLVCAGQSVTLCIPTGGTLVYQWYLNGAPITTGGNNNCYTVTTGGNYKVAATNLATGCADTSIVTPVTISPLPTLTVTSNSATTFCNGSRDTLTAVTNGGVIQWFQNGVAVTGVLPTANAGNLIYIATTTGAYTAVATSSTGCTTTSTAINVTVNTTPSTVTALGSTTFCPGGSVTLQGPTPPTGTTFTYQWYNGTTAIAAPLGTAQSYTATTGGNYSVVVTNTTTGCSAQSAQTTVNVSGAGPSSAITPAGAVLLCTGSSLTLYTTRSPGLTYQWYNGTTPLGTADTQVVTASGSYTVKVSIATNPSCYSQTTTPTVVTISPLPTVSITASGAPTTFCQGNNVTLTATASAGTTIRWYNGTTAVTPPAPASMVTYVASVTGVYTAVVTNTSTGCTQTSNTIPVTANPLPVAIIVPQSSTTFCAGGSVILKDSPSVYSSYVWNMNGVATSVIATSYTATATGLYSVTVTDANGCRNTSALTSVQVNPLPTVAITPAVNFGICQGTTAIIRLTTPNSNYSYQWYNGTTAIGGATRDSFVVSTAGSYYVKVTNIITGCTANSVTDVVIVATPPTAVATLVGTPTICDGDSSRINATTGTGLSYIWMYNGNRIQGLDTTLSTYYAKLGGSYTVIVKNSTGCASTSNSININVNPRPAAFITYNTPLSFCAGTAVVLNANQTAGITGYVWLVNGVPTSNTSTAFIADSTGIYSLRTTNGFGCSTTSDTLHVTNNPRPTPAIERFVTDSLQTTRSYSSYQWFFNNVAVGGATNRQFRFTQNGAYKVRVIDANGCEGFSELMFINNVGITPSSLSAGIKVYPNPTTGLLRVDAPVKVKLALRDVTGKTVAEAEAVKEMDITRLSNGIYLLYISDMNGVLLRADKVTKTAN